MRDTFVIFEAMTHCPRTCEKMGLTNTRWRERSFTTMDAIDIHILGTALVIRAEREIALDNGA